MVALLLHESHLNLKGKKKKKKKEAEPHVHGHQRTCNPGAGDPHGGCRAVPGHRLGTSEPKWLPVAPEDRGLAGTSRALPRTGGWWFEGQAGGGGRLDHPDGRRGRKVPGEATLAQAGRLG